MALRNSTNGEITRHYSIEELKNAANLMRGYDLVALNAAGSGHAGGTLSIMDITAALCLRVAEHDPGNSLWRIATASSGLPVTKRPVFISGWPLPASRRRRIPA